MADPLISLGVGLLILYNSWRLVKDSVDILLEGTPAHIDLETVHGALNSVEGVESIDDLHIWTLTSGIHAMSCHAVVCGSDDRHQILEQLSEIVRRRFKIDHTTIQLEEVNLVTRRIIPANRMRHFLKDIRMKHFFTLGIIVLAGQWDLPALILSSSSSGNS